MKRFFVPSLVFIALLPAAIAAAAAPQSAEDAAVEVLQKHDYPFCQPGTNALASEREWCLVAELATTCPDLAKMCQRPQPGDKPSDSQTQANSPRSQPRKVGVGGSNVESVSGPASALSPLWPLLKWLLIGVGIAVLIGFIVRAIAARKQLAQSPAKRPDAKIAADPVAAMTPATLGEIELLLQRARATADHDVAAAVALLYAACLRRLSDIGLIRFRAASSNREYLRSIVGKTPLEQPLRQLVREVELAKFGQVQPDRSRFDALIAEIAPLLRQTTKVLLFSTVALLSACFAWGDANLTGHAAAWEILRSQGIEVTSFTQSLADLGPDSAPLLVDAEEVPLTDEVLRVLAKAVRQGARVLLLPAPAQDLEVWLPVQVTEIQYSSSTITGQSAHLHGHLPQNKLLIPTERFWHWTWYDDADSLRRAVAQMFDFPMQSAENREIEQQGAATSSAMAAAASEVVAGNDISAEAVAAEEVAVGLTTDDTQATQISEPGETLLMRNTFAFARKWKIGKGVVVVVADRDLFANGAMAIPGNPTLMTSVVNAMIGGQKQMTIATLGIISPAEDPHQSLQRAGIWPLMLQILLILSLWLLLRGLPFGTLRDREVQGRRAFSEHISAVALQLSRKKQSTIAAHLYAGYALDRLWQRHGPRGQSRDIEVLAIAIGLRFQRDSVALLQALRRAETLRNLPATQIRQTSSEDLQLVLVLSDLIDGDQRLTPPNGDTDDGL